ncbi:hypothetical protein [Variovorax paradoxus]|uniref:Uncharacterized protein n=1 Tax=Variovorax paradoxus TaxID=34073 RepID=A0A6I6HF54_VARPD|nr:hypothetical protein [Variovorax paradoxus]QGW80828.1 hypothetical protein GOQ09_04170 [Variovorax paradoxus]
MNLYPPDETVSGPLAPADWTMAVGLEGQGDGAFYFADIQRARKNVCRLVVAGVKSEDEARRLLAVKARHWIDDYLSRPHSGTTAFDPLDR